MATTQPPYPRHRSIFAADIDGSSRHSDPTKAYLRRSMYKFVERALEAGGVARPHRDPFVDRGDGVLALVHPVDQAPKTVLLDAVVPRLSSLLAQHNACHPDRAYQLRVVVHAGEVTYDDNGPFGEALDVAFHLLNADRVKRSLRAAAKAPMVLVVSDDFYQCVVRHDYPGINPRTYKRVILPRISGQVRSGWVRTINAE
jgi:hypothetical protein